MDMLIFWKWTNDYSYMEDPTEATNLITVMVNFFLALGSLSGEDAVYNS